MIKNIVKYLTISTLLVFGLHSLAKATEIGIKDLKLGLDSSQYFSQVLSVDVSHPNMFFLEFFSLHSGFYRFHFCGNHFIYEQVFFQLEFDFIVPNFYDNIVVISIYFGSFGVLLKKC